MIQQERFSPLGQFFIFLFTFGCGIILSVLAVILCGKLMLGISLQGLAVAISDTSNIEFARVVQTVGSFCMMVIPVFLFSMFMGKNPFRYAGFSTRMNFTQLGIVFVTAGAALFASGALAELNQWIPLPAHTAAYFKQLEDTYNKEVLSIASIKNSRDYVISLFVLALLPAIFEEMFFRGGLQQILIKWTRHAFWGILITSICFSAFHASYYGFLPRLFLGMMLGYLFFYGKNLWLNIFAHFLNNAIAVTQMYLLSRQGKLTAQAMNENPPLYYGLFGIAAVIFLLFLFRNISRNIPAPATAPDDQFNIH